MDYGMRVKHGTEYGEGSVRYGYVYPGFHLRIFDHKCSCFRHFVFDYGYVQGVGYAAALPYKCPNLH